MSPPPVEAAVRLPLAPALPAPPVALPSAAAAAPRPHLYLAVFGSWLLAVAWFHPRLAGLFAMAETPLAWAALAFFVAFTELAWLYAFFNVGVLAFAAWYRRSPDPQAADLPAPRQLPAVALLYTTCNDFVEASALSCVSQRYPSFTVYLLDDSSDPAFRARVDAFAARHPARVRVVRRPDRRGFKAGNINHALTRATCGEPLFALADADEILPPDFLSRTARYLLADPSCGFVQANHRANPRAATSFAATLGQGIDVHWRWYQPLRNRYGFVMLLGHGALLRRAAWRAVGGFPELVSEDLAFALRIREQGWRGRFAEDVVCYEDFPEDMRAFRVRHMKWTRGTCEFLSREMWRALRSPRIPLVEKLDVLFPTLNLPLSLVYFLFVLDANLLLTSLFGQVRPMTLELGGLALVLPTLALDDRFRAIMTADFYAITLLTFTAPILCFILDMWRTPLRLLRFLGSSTVAYGALGPLSSLGVLFYLLTGKAVFHVTADRGAAPGGSTGVASWTVRLRAGWRNLLAGSHPDRLAVQLFEVTCGLGMAFLAVRMFQVSALGLALGFLLLPIAHHVRWEHKALRAVVHLPLALVVGGLLLGGLSLFGLQTVLFGYGFHF